MDESLNRIAYKTAWCLRTCKRHADVRGIAAPEDALVQVAIAVKPGDFVSRTLAHGDDRDSGL